jgi:glycosyltransferase involved in cell wall biosynthesis
LRILRICQDIPYPPRDGASAEPFHLTRYLAQAGHEITLVGLQREPADTSPLELWCELHKIPFAGRNTLFGMARGVLENFPVNYVKYRDPRLLATCLELLRRRSYDVVIVDLSAMGWHALQIKRHCKVPVVTRWHNVDTLIWERWANSQENALKRTLGKYHAGLVRRFERQLALASDLCLTMGAKDLVLLRQLAPEAHVQLLPLGVDVDFYTPVSAGQETTSILYLASGYQWHPNYDAAKWLYDEIMPRVWQQLPDAKLYISGRDIRPEMESWATTGRVIFTGFVQDDRALIAKAGVLVVPMRLGGGIKLKVLTAFAAGKAVVSTETGAEGIQGLTDGDQLLIRDAPDEFAAAVLNILRNEPLRRNLEVRGRAFVSERYAWPALARRWEQVLTGVIERRASRFRNLDHAPAMTREEAESQDEYLVGSNPE